MYIENGSSQIRMVNNFDNCQSRSEFQVICKYHQKDQNKSQEEEFDLKYRLSLIMV